MCVKLRTKLPELIELKDNCFLISWLLIKVKINVNRSFTVLTCVELCNLLSLHIRLSVKLLYLWLGHVIPVHAVQGRLHLTGLGYGWGRRRTLHCGRFGRVYNTRFRTYSYNASLQFSDISLDPVHTQGQGFQHILKNNFEGFLGFSIVVHTLPHYNLRSIKLWVSYCRAGWNFYILITFKANKGRLMWF